MLKELVSEVMRFPENFANWFTDWVDRFVLANHQPVDLGDGIYCTNHWGKPKPVWPCNEALGAFERIRSRRESES